MAKRREACGRCSASVVVDAAAERSEDEREARDPYGTERIEVDEDELRTISPDGWIAGLAARIDDAVGRLTWGR